MAEETEGEPASPVCYADELDAESLRPLSAAEQARQVAQWRREERARLIMTYGGKVVLDLFGGDHQKLPVQLIDLDDPEDEDEDESEEEAADSDGGVQGPPVEAPKKTLTLSK